VTRVLLCVFGVPFWETAVFLRYPPPPPLAKTLTGAGSAGNNLFDAHVLFTLLCVLAVTGLIYVVLSCDVVADHFAVGIPSNPLAELGLMLVPENVFVGYQPPNTESLRCPFFRYSNFAIWNESIDCSGENRYLARAYDTSIFNYIFRERESKFLRNRYLQNISSDSDRDISGWSIPIVYKAWSCFKPKVFLARSPSFLKNMYVSHYDREVGANYRLVSRFDSFGYFFHCVRRPRSFPDMALHGFSLFSRGFDRLSQFFSLVGIHQELQKSDENESASEPHDMPIIRRFIVAIFGLLCGFLLCLQGWNSLDHQRRLLGAALVCSGCLLAGGGLLLFWLTNFPRTWAWLL